MLKPKENKIKKFIMGKGFYAVLALCLVGAGTAAWLSVNKTLGALSAGESSSLLQDPVSYYSKTDETSYVKPNTVTHSKADEKENSRWEFSETEPVDTPVKDVPIFSESSSSSQQDSESVSSQQQSSERSEKSEQQTLSPSSRKPAFRLPLSGEIFNPFSDGELIKNETLNEWRTHDGIDIRAAIGSEIHAAAQGEITAVDKDTLWGNYIEIDHGNGYISYYYGLDDNISVKAGDKVMGGDTIGLVGESNSAELAMDAHLHFAIKHNGSWVDPVETINS
ncbi:MAG: M23 family metallopeptidase [Oscillospiraceae bacterium]|nr:M23 family metallopeptidase [Oscillospiraceae bacterium]